MQFFLRHNKRPFFIILLLLTLSTLCSLSWSFRPYDCQELGGDKPCGPATLGDNQMWRVQSSSGGSSPSYQYYGQEDTDTVCEIRLAQRTYSQYTLLNFDCGFTYTGVTIDAKSDSYCLATNWCNNKVPPSVSDAGPYGVLTRVVCVNGRCKNPGYCPLPFTLASETSCEARCKNGQAWDKDTLSCIAPTKEQGCKTETAHPISFIEGKKLRAEPVIAVGARSKISMVYYYDNQKNDEQTVSAVVPNVGPKQPDGSVNVIKSDTYVAAKMAPIPLAESYRVYNPRGLRKDAPNVLPNQHFGAIEQYWRHNFDEVLQITGGQYLLRMPTGKNIYFPGLGPSTTYPHLNLQKHSVGELNGFKVVNQKNNTVKKFDMNGRLTEIERAANDVLTLTYDFQNRLDRITSSEGDYLSLTYVNKSKDSIYSVARSIQSYPKTVTANTGKVVRLNWLHSHMGQTARFHLLTEIAILAKGAATTARVFEYNDSRWPVSITDIFDVSNVEKDTRTLYAHFEYDDLGRAVVSELADGHERVQVNYLDANTRTITNALGKNATYTFDDFDGVTRLQSVKGEASSNCVESNTDYTYYPKGMVKTKTTNGTVTHYQYNDKNQKTVVTEAKGTALERVTKTCWHAKHNKPERTIEPASVTIFEYFDNGQLKSQKVEARSASNERCK